MKEKHGFEKFSISVPQTLFKWIEAKRGLIPRSRFIATILNEAARQGEK